MSLPLLIHHLSRFTYDDPLKPLGEHWSPIYQFFLGSDLRPHGFILEATANKMPWATDFAVDHGAKTVHLSPIDTVTSPPSHTPRLCQSSSRKPLTRTRSVSSMASIANPIQLLEQTSLFQLSDMLAISWGSYHVVPISRSTQTALKE
jgi:hypothetical protein